MSELGEPSIEIKSSDDIPALLLSDCWSILAAERKRIAARPPLKTSVNVFTPNLLRDLYVRADIDRDGRIEMEEMHDLLSTYLSDLIGENVELPRGFSMAVTRAVISTKDKDFVGWSEFSVGFPKVVRQRHLLWDQWNSRIDLRLD